MSRNYERARVVSIETVFSMINENGQHNSHVFCGHNVGLSSVRIRNFHANGITCKHCGLVGVYFAVERSNHKWKSERDWHLNLYALNEQWHEILMTRDHIMPKSKGGKDHLSNCQTLCTYCNCKKSDKLPDVTTEWFNTTTDIRDSTREDNTSMLQGLYCTRN